MGNSIELKYAYFCDLLILCLNLIKDRSVFETEIRNFDHLNKELKEENRGLKNLLVDKVLALEV